MAKRAPRLEGGYQQLLNAAKGLLQRTGYYRDTEALEVLGWQTEGGRHLVKTLRPAVIKELSLFPLQLNATEKERLSIAWAGYPRVWVQTIEDSRS